MQAYIYLKGIVGCVSNCTTEDFGKTTQLLENAFFPHSNKRGEI